METSHQKAENRKKENSLISSAQNFFIWDHAHAGPDKFILAAFFKINYT